MHGDVWSRPATTVAAASKACCVAEFARVGERAHPRRPHGGRCPSGLPAARGRVRGCCSRRRVVVIRTLAAAPDIRAKDIALEIVRERAECRGRASDLPCTDHSPGKPAPYWHWACPRVEGSQADALRVVWALVWFESRATRRTVSRYAERERERYGEEAFTALAQGDEAHFRSTGSCPLLVRYCSSVSISAVQASLGLKMGLNTITFGTTSRLQGVQEVTSNIFLWTEDAKVVISDIDGTITRSDVLGQVLPMWGKDWCVPAQSLLSDSRLRSHVGVAELLTNIKKQGYQVLYLTARAIGQARGTRDYIYRLRQGNASLPMGPIITTPDSLFAVRQVDDGFVSAEKRLQAFNREVIRRRPDEFKIQALTDIQKLFPLTWNPFYAGFGNRETVLVLLACLSPVLMHRGRMPSLIVLWGFHWGEFSLLDRRGS